MWRPRGTQHHPELLILDEPTSGLSPLARSRLWNVIRQQSEAGTAVLVSTHYMLGDELAAVEVDLERAGVAATKTRLVPASLNETLVELSRRQRPDSA